MSLSITDNPISIKVGMMNIAADASQTQILEATKALISDERHWTTDHFRRRRLFFSQYCVMGALNRVVNTMMDKKGVLNPEDAPKSAQGASGALAAASLRVFGGSAIQVNDNLGFVAIHRVLAKAITVSREIEEYQQRMEIAHLDFVAVSDLVAESKYALSA